jgi:hypothetical protein
MDERGVTHIRERLAGMLVQHAGAELDPATAAPVGDRRESEDAPQPG